MNLRPGPVRRNNREYGRPILYALSALAIVTSLWLMRDRPIFGVMFERVASLNPFDSGRPMALNGRNRSGRIEIPVINLWREHWLLRATGSRDRWRTLRCLLASVRFHAMTPSRRTEQNVAIFGSGGNGVCAINTANNQVTNVFTGTVGDFTAGLAFLGLAPKVG